MKEPAHLRMGGVASTTIDEGGTGESDGESEGTDDESQESGSVSGDYDGALVFSSEMAMSVGTSESGNSEDEEALFLSEDEGDSEFLNDSRFTYNNDQENNTLYVTLQEDVSEDIVVLDSLTGKQNERFHLILDLNGRTLTPLGEKNHTGITVFGMLTIRDSSVEKKGKVDGSGLNNVRGIEVAERGVLRLEGGTICNFHSNGNGAGVTINEGGRLIMAGGSISGNVSGQNGGGVFAYEAHSVTFENGTENIVAANSAKNGGGFAFALTGTKIYDEEADGTGTDNVWELNSVTLFGNRASENGGALYFDEEIEARFVASGLMAGNIADGNGGGAYFRAKSTVTVNQGTRLAGNTSKNGNGGSLYMNGADSALTLDHAIVGVEVSEAEETADRTDAEEDPEKETVPLKDTVDYGADEEDAQTAAQNPSDRAAILEMAKKAVGRGNLAENGRGGGFYIYRKSSLTVKDSDISRNKAYYHGGGFYLDSENKYTADALIQNSRFERNVLDGYTGGQRYGAGAHIGSYAKVTVSGSLFRRNRGASLGSGLSINTYNKGVTVTDSIFEKNHIMVVHAPDGAAGGGLYVGDSGSVAMTLEGCTFRYNRTDTESCGSSGFRGGNTTKTVTNCTFYRNESTGSGAGASFGGVTEIVDCLFEENRAYHYRRGSSGGGISASGSKLIVKGNTVFRGNYARYQGAGIYSSNTECHLEAGVQILDNIGAASWGGGVHASGTLYIHDGVTVKGNKCSDLGGGIYAAHLRMDGGLVSGNTGGNGGGICVTYSAEISGGEISGNTATSWGGGLGLRGYGNVTISGGKITGNLAKGSSGGGGICAFTSNDSSLSYLLTLKGDVEISGNTSNTVGGGVSLNAYNAHCLIEENARITGNTAQTNGGGVYLAGYGDSNTASSKIPLAYDWSLHIKDNQVFDNHAYNWGNDLYSYSYVRYDWAYNRTKYRLEKSEGGIWYDEKNSSYLTEAYDNLAENAIYEDPENYDGDPQRKERKTHGVTVNNYYTFVPEPGIRAEIRETGVKYMSVQEAMNASKDGETVVMLSDSLENVIVPENRKVTLDLAGFSLRALRTGSVLTLSNGADLTLQDSSEAKSGIIADGKGSKIVLEGKDFNRPNDTYGGGVYVKSKAKFTLESGKITNNNASYGSGVYLEDEAEMLMTGGSVSGNTGGGVCVFYGDQLWGDPVKSESSYYPVSGMNYWSLGASFTMTGGEISANTGRGIIFYGASSEVKISGEASITGNKGGGIYGQHGNGNYMNREGEYYQTTNLRIDGVDVSRNSCTGAGAGIWLGSVKAVLSNCRITDNATDDNSSRVGGGLSIGHDKADVLLQNVRISGNKGGLGGGIGVSSASAKLVIESGAIYGNTIVSGLKMHGSDIYLCKGANNVTLLDALKMSMPEGEDFYSCWMNEVTGEKYAELSVDIPDLYEKTKDAALYLIAERDPAILGSARIGETPYPTLQSAINAANAIEESGDGEGETVIYLLRDLKESVLINGKRNIIIDLNGYDIRCERNQVFYLERPTGTVTVRSTVTEDDARKVDGEKKNSGCIIGAGSSSDSESMRAVTIYGGSFTVEDGVTIKDFHISGSGGAAYVYPSQTNGNHNAIFTMKPGSRIANCSATGGGGAIYAELPNSFTAVCQIFIEGAVIEDCDANSYGGAIYAYFDRYRKNSSVTDKNTLLINGGSILQRNTVHNYRGGAVYVQNYNGAANTLEDHQEDIAIYDAQILNNVNLSRVNYQCGGVSIYYGFPQIGREDIPKERTVFRGNKSYYTVGGLQVTGEKLRDRAFITNVTISGNYADYTTGGLSVGVPAVIKGCLIEDNHVNRIDGYTGGLGISGPATTDESFATLVQDTVIKGNSARYGGGMNMGLMASGTRFENVQFIDNDSISDGGAIRVAHDNNVYYAEDSKLTFDKCLFEGNIGNDIGAVYLSHYYVTFEFHDCEFKGNKARSATGTAGIYHTLRTDYKPGLEKYGTLLLSGSTDIHDNEGRGVYGNVHTVIQDDVRIRNNKITGNGSNSGYGAGLYQYGGWMELLGGTIEGNKADNGFGGGVFLQYSSNTWNLEQVQGLSVLDGVKILGNEALYGGGIYMSSLSRLAMKSGQIRDNSAVEKGGGVYMSNNQTLFDMERGQIFDNNASYGRDLFGSFSSSYRTSEFRLIKASDMFLDDSDDSVQRRGICWIEERLDNIIDDKIQGVLVYELPLTLNFQTIKPAVAVKKSDGSDYIIYNSVQDAITAILDGVHGSFTGEEKPEIVLVDDVSENVQIPGSADVVINLNGYTLRGNGSSAVTVYGNVRIVDEKKELSSGSEAFHPGDAVGTVTGTSGQVGGGVYVVSGGNAVLSSGQIANCRAGGQQSSDSYGGSAVCIDAGTFTLEGEGAIRQNTAYYSGAAILIRNVSGSFLMTGGVIEENSSLKGSGILYNKGGKVRISGGSIRNNTVASQGILYNASGEMNITGASAEQKVEISGNSAVNRGGAIYLATGKIYLSNVLISGNEVTLARQASVDNVTGAGGAIYQNNGILYMNEGTEIRGNKASRGGGIYQNGGTAYLMGGVVTDNTAEIGGGIAQYPLKTMTFIVSRGLVAGNHTTLYGSGNDIYSWYEGKDGKFDDPLLVTNKPKLTIMPAEMMGDVAYNAWKDDTYKGTNRTAQGISNSENVDEGGQYITGSIISSANLQLTAAYYDTEVEKEYDADVFVQSIQFQVRQGETGNGITDGTGKVLPEIEATEIVAKNMEGAEPVTEGDHKGMYLYEGKYYEPEQMASWTAGSDGNTQNLLVRSFDTVTYSIRTSLVAMKGVDSGVDREVRTWLEVTLPCSPEEAEFDTDKAALEFKDAPSINIRETEDGTVQVMTGYYDQPMKDAENVYKSIVIKVGAMMNGDTLKPHFRTWVEGNEDNVTVIPGYTEPVPGNTQNSSSPEQQENNSENPAASLLNEEENDPDPKETGDNNGQAGAQDETVTEIDSPVLTISAAPKYNAAIDYNSHLAYDSYFDLTRGIEVSKDDYKKAKANGDSSIVHGMMVGYGIIVSLYNDGATDGLKGVELPDKELEFDVSFKGKLYYNGEPMFAEGSEYASLAESKPIIWAYKENEDTPTGKPLNEVSLYSRTMDWNDEDDVVKDTRFAYDAAPFNSGGGEKACYNGGSWYVTEGPEGKNPLETNIHVKVTNYVLNGDSRPNQTSDGTSDNRFNTAQVKPFTAGYVQLLYPYDEDDIKEAYRNEYKDHIGGYVAVGMDASVTKLSAKGRSGRTALSKEDKNGLDTLNMYYGLDDPMDLLKATEEREALATCEMRYGDNYSFNDFARYLYEGDGNGDTLSKTTYFLTADRKTLTGSEGKGSTPISSVVYAGGSLGFGSAVIHTDDITDKKHYIDSKDFNTSTDNLVEYNYMTAMNFFQKFDAEVFHPAYMDAYIDQEYKGAGQENNNFTGYTGPDKTGTKVQPFQIKTSEAKAEWDTAQTDKPKAYRLTILYAAKPDGENWVKVYNEEDGSDDGGAADMDKYHEENMLYYPTLQELEADGKTCVGILFEFRDMAIRTHKSVSVHTYLDVTDDFTKTGNTYITTNDARAWATYRRFYKETWRKSGNQAENMRGILYNYSYLTDDSYEPYPVIDDWADRKANRQRYGEGESSPGASDSLKERSSWTRKLYKRADSDNPESETVADGEYTFEGYTYFIGECHRDFNNYKKTQYQNGVRVAGTHNGWDRGNVLLLYTLDTSIQIVNTDIQVGSNTAQTAYNVSKGERTVNYRVAPAITLSSGATSTELVKNGSQTAKIYIELEIPKGLTYKKGSISYEYEKSGYTADELEWGVELVDNGDGTQKVVLTTFVNDIEKKLPTFTFSCDIGNIKNEEEDVKQGQSLLVLSRIYAEYQEIDRLAAEAHESSNSITIIKDGNDGIKKDVEEVLVEIGEDIVYTLHYMNGSSSAANIRFGDVLPFIGDKRSTSFTGAYRVSGIRVSFTDEASYRNYLGQSADGSEIEGADKGRVLYLAGQTVPAKTSEQEALMDKMKTANELLDGSDGVTMTNDIKTTEEGETEYIINYDIDSEALLQKASTESGIALFGYFPKLSGTGAENAEDTEAVKQGVTVRIVLTATKPGELADGGKDFLVDEKAGKNVSSVQTGGNKYTNNFMFCGGSFTAPAKNVLRSSSVSVSTVGRTISGKVWLDKDNDHYYVSSGRDSLMKGVYVRLMKLEADGTYSVAKDILGRNMGEKIGDEWYMLTSDKGEYSFNNLAAGQYKVEISDPNNGYISMKDKGTKTPQPLPFDQLTLTKLNEKAKNTNRGIYAGDEVKDAGSQLVARTMLIPMPEKKNIGGGLFVSSNWNFGLYYMYPNVEKDWINNAFELPAGSTLELSLRGYIPEGAEAVTDANVGIATSSNIVADDNTNAGNDSGSGGNGQDGNSPNSNSQNEESGQPGIEAGSSNANAKGEEVYSNKFTFTIKNDKNRTQSLTTEKSGLNGWNSGTFKQTIVKKDDGSAPDYIWTLDVTDQQRFPLPVTVYRDGKQYRVSYALSEAMAKLNVEKESYFEAEVPVPLPSGDGSELLVKAVNTRPLSGFDFLKADTSSGEIRPIIEVDPVTGEKLHDRDLQDVTFRLFRSRSDADVVDPTYPGISPAHEDKLDVSDKSAMLITMVKLDNGKYRPRYSTDPVSGKNIVKDMVITQDTGRLSVEGLPAGAYWLLETKAQDGYGLPGGFWKILVLPKENAEDSGKLVVFGSVKSQPKIITEDTASILGEEPVNKDTDIKKQTIKGTSFILPNTPGLVMARTGGSGTRGIVLLGLLAAMAGAAGWWLDRRRRRTV